MNKLFTALLCILIPLFCGANKSIRFYNNHNQYQGKLVPSNNGYKYYNNRNQFEYRLDNRSHGYSVYNNKNQYKGQIRGKINK